MVNDGGRWWGIVLAGGEGTRLRSMTTDAAGIAVPKQFCSIDGRRTMVRAAIDRAARSVPRDRIVVVVTERHRPFWASELADLPPGNVVVQPRARGTAPGIMLPLLHVLARDAGASVLVLPSDHHVDGEEVFAEAARTVLGETADLRDQVTLLGMEPGHAETEYGWIVPSDTPRGSCRAVREFVEKPDPERCQRLYRSGALWNSFAMVATVRSLMGLCARRAAGVLRSFATAAQDGMGGQGVLERLYDALPPCDFSRDILAGGHEHLAVMRVPDCGWTDLGTPERVRRCLSQWGIDAAAVGSLVPGSGGAAEGGRRAAAG